MSGRPFCTDYKICITSESELTNSCAAHVDIKTINVISALCLISYIFIFILNKPLRCFLSNPWKRLRLYY